MAVVRWAQPEILEIPEMDTQTLLLSAARRKQHYQSGTDRVRA